MAAIKLKGIGWDHPRGFGCYKDTVHIFQSENPDIEIEWDTRSLKDFGEAPIGPLADAYDFLIIDHPFSGKARSSGCLTDLNQLVPDLVEAALKDEVGQSARSYHYDGGVWGLPTDSAAQIAVYRPDRMAELGYDVPQTHDDVLRLARELRKQGAYMAVPACPIDSVCLVMTYAANLGHPPASASGGFLPDDVLDTVLDLVQELVSLAHPKSLDSNPIHMHEHMIHNDDIVYVPLMFGYSNYSRQGRKPLLKTANFAGPGKIPYAGSLLGGAGCAVSSRCKHPEAAARYLRWLHQPKIMAGAYFLAGGQPGSRRVWLDAQVNDESNDFFRSTLNTLDHSYLRPRHPGFVPFFENSGLAVNAFLKGNISKAELKKAILNSYDDQDSAAII